MSHAASRLTPIDSVLTADSYRLAGVRTMTVVSDDRVGGRIAFGRLVVASFERVQRTIRADEPDLPLVMLDTA